MKRKIDNLGRLVIPAEMKKQLEIKNCELVNIECSGDKIIITNPSKVDYKARIDKAIEFLENEYNTYPSAEEWRNALKNILKGE